MLFGKVDRNELFFFSDELFCENTFIITLLLQLVPRLQRLYRSIEEVDLYIGGTIERPLEGSLLGPTFQCIVGDQFRRLRLGDR